MVKRCTCAGESSECERCGGTGFVNGQGAPHREEWEKVRAAMAAKTEVTATHSQAPQLEWSKLRIQSYRDHTQQCLRRLKPLQRCTVFFKETFEFAQQCASVMASRTKVVLEELHAGETTVFWNTPNKCKVLQFGSVSYFDVTNEGKVTRRYNPAIQISRIPSTSLSSEGTTRPVLSVVKPSIAPKKKEKTKSGCAEGAKQKDKGPKLGAKKKLLNKGASKLPKNRLIPQKKPSVFNTALQDAWVSAINERENEKKLDATFGRHVFREVGSQQFGSSPSYDDYDN